MLSFKGEIFYVVHFTFVQPSQTKVKELGGSPTPISKEEASKIFAT